MFLEKLLNQGKVPLLESMLQFTASRHRLLAEDVVNMDTPNYRQKDLSLEKFLGMLRQRAEERRDAPPGSVGFDDIQAELEHPTRGILAHDGNNRSAEQLFSDQAKNALMHNIAIELLRKQYATMELALKDKLG